MADRALKYSDKRWQDDPGATVVLCSTCQRFLFAESKDQGKLVCTEYPEGIPEVYIELIADEDTPPECYQPEV